MEREEAINLVKQVLPCLNIDEKIREGFETLIPELKENEDERIRMALIKLMTVAGENYVRSATGFEKEQLIAYLERQQEQKPILDFKASNWYVSKVDGKIHDMTYNPTDKVEPKWIIKTGKGGPRYEENPKYGQIIEQKPVEYLSKDKVYAIMNKLTELSTSELIPLNSDEYKKINEITSDVRSLLDYPIEQKPGVTINGEPIPTENQSVDIPLAEWSDEDEILLVRTINRLETLNFHGISGKEIRESIDWLKSFPERFNLQAK